MTPGTVPRRRGGATIGRVRQGALVALGSLLLAAAAGAVSLGYGLVFSSTRALPGTYVAGKIPPESETLGDFLERRRVELLSHEAWLVLPTDTRRTTFGELGIELDVAQTMRRVEEHAERGNLGARLHRRLKARRGEAEVEAAWSFDPQKARVLLERLAPEVWLDPVDARLDLVEHRRIEEQPGRELDVEKTLAEIENGERSELSVFRVMTKASRPQVTINMLSAIDITKVLSSFETDFGGSGRGRVQNITRAAELLNGTVLAPGQTVSFNRLVGERRVDRGFAWAPEIVNDEMENGVGGGVCQVATTLHASAVFGVLDVLERRSHSRPSAYAQMGLDATVIYGKVDLKLKNPYDSPLILHAFLPAKSRLRVELLGRDPPGKVEHVYAVTKSEDFFRRITTKPELEAGKQIRKQKGIRGYDIVSVVRVTHSDGSVEQHQYRSRYYPVPEVYWVGAGVAADSLPELPKGASYVEVDGAKDASSIENPYATGG